ncbi:MAG: hypothetical protein K2O37_02090 [Bacteroidales bacterium]|nr:hypothetical protein [Bacteroidales bacterium]MDE7101566.1 hypothetical protein [Bacteroidales bacterium]
MKKIILLSALVSFAFVGCKCNKTAETCVANEEAVEVVEEGEGVVAETEVVEAAEVPAEVPAE